MIIGELLLFKIVFQNFFVLRQLDDDFLFSSFYSLSLSLSLYVPFREMQTFV